MSKFKRLHRRNIYSQYSVWDCDTFANAYFVFFWRKNLSNLPSRLIFISFWPRVFVHLVVGKLICLSPSSEIKKTKKTMTKSKKQGQVKESELMMTNIFSKVLARGHGHFFIWFIFLWAPIVNLSSMDSQVKQNYSCLMGLRHFCKCIFCVFLT